MITVSQKCKGTKFEDAVLLSFKYDAQTVERIKQLPNRWYRLAEKSWEIPVEDIPFLINKFGVEGVRFEDKEILRDMATNSSQTISERLRGIQTVVPYEFKTVPYPHQIEGFNYGVTKGSLLLGDEQGLGKTKQGIDVAVHRKYSDGVNKCLIICGVNSVKYNWEMEVKMHSNERAYVLDADSTKDRILQLKDWALSNKYFGIINIESLRKPDLVAELERYINSNIIGLVIVDEIHKAKNGMSLQGKALRKIKPRYRIGMTGTPIMNKADELWNILSWLGVEKRSFYAFRSRYCNMGGYGGYQVVGYKNLDELNGLLNRVMLRRKKDDVLDLPDKIIQNDYLEMTERQRMLYNEIRLGLISQIDDIVLNPNPLTSLLRLRQCTGGILGDDNPKLDRIKELMEDIAESGQKAVIFSQWEKVTRVLKRELRQYHPAYITGDVTPQQRQREMERFQLDNECKVIIGTIGAMGTGLTLTAGTYVIFTDKAWTPADNEQAMDRCHRIGTKGTVNVITLVAKNTIDERIEEVLSEKKELFEQIVEGKNITKFDRKELLEKLLSME